MLRYNNAQVKIYMLFVICTSCAASYKIFAICEISQNADFKPNASSEVSSENLSFVRKNRGLIWSDLLVCSEIKWIRDAIRDFFDSNDFLVSKEFVSECLRVASDSDKAKYSIRVDGMKPEQVALIIIRNVANTKLIYGDHHVYRGVLSIAGREYKRVFYGAVRLYAQLGFGTKDEAMRELSDINKAISEVG